jgi:predicted RNase H-like HicB family nuclease
VTDTHLYPAHVFWSDEDEGYIALATDLPGCSAFGDTQSEALRELQDAIAAWIEAQRAAGNPVPAPSRPSREHSGKVLLRMPRSLHAKLAFAASDEDVSLNQYIVHVLSAGGMDQRGRKAPRSRPSFGGKARAGATRLPAKTVASGRLVKTPR